MAGELSVRYSVVIRSEIETHVLGLSVLSENTWGNLVHLANKLVHLVIRKMFLMIISQNPLSKRDYSYLGEFTLGHITGISLAENGMAITWNNLTSLESGPKVVGDGLIAEIVANGSLHLGEPVQDFLVGETVERTSKTIETSGKGQHRGAESTSNQVSGVGANITTLMISVDSKVKSHQLDEVGVVSEAQLVGEVETVILILLNRCNFAALEDVLVDSSSDGWELGNQIHRILESVSPVFGFLHSLGVCLRECRLVLESIDCDRKLCHWVKVIRAAIDKLLDELGNIGAGGPLGGKVADLLLARNFSCQEQPEKT